MHSYSFKYAKYKTLSIEFISTTIREPIRESLKEFNWRLAMLTGLLKSKARSVFLVPTDTDSSLDIGTSTVVDIRSPNSSSNSNFRRFWSMVSFRTIPAINVFPEFVL